MRKPATTCRRSLFLGTVVVLFFVVSCREEVYAAISAWVEPEIRKYVPDGQDNRDWMYGIQLNASTIGSGLYPVAVGAAYLQGNTSEGVRKDYVFDALMHLGGRSDLVATYLLGDTTDGGERNDIEVGVDYNVPPPSGHAGPLDLYVGGRQLRDEGTLWQGLAAEATLSIRPIKSVPLFSLIGEVRYLHALESLSDLKAGNLTGRAGLSYGFWNGRLGNASAGTSASAGYRWKELTTPGYAYLSVSCSMFW